MHNISCLHSARTDIAVFETARRALMLDHVMLKHRVRSDLVSAAGTAGIAGPDILEQAVLELCSLARGAHGVLLTSSTLGPAATLAAARLAVPILRTDEALAHEAVRNGGNVVVLCATGAAITPTRALFDAASMATGAEIEIRVVPGAWDLLRAGRTEDGFRLIAEAADTASEEGATVALAQASMAGAARFATRVTPLTGPAVALSAIVAAIQEVAVKSS